MKKILISLGLVVALGALIAASINPGGKAKVSSVNPATNFLWTVMGTAEDSPIRGVSPSNLLDSIKTSANWHALSNLNASATLVVDPAGSDATAIRGRLDRPWANPYAAALSAQNGDTILIRAGTYSLTGIVAIASTAPPIRLSALTNVNIIGAGRNSTIITSTVPGTIFEFIHCKGIRCQDFSIGQALGANEQDYANLFGTVAINGTNSDFQFRNVDLFNSSDHGFCNLGYEVYGWPNGKGTNILWENCRVYHAGATNNVFASAAPVSDGVAWDFPGGNCTLVNCEAHDCVRDLEVESSDGSAFPNLKVSGFRSTGNLSAIFCNYGADMPGLLLENCTFEGIWNRTQGTEIYAGRNSTIKNCSFLNMKTGIFFTDSTADATSWQLIDNHFTNITSYAICLTDGTATAGVLSDFMVSGNQIYMVGGAGIVAHGTQIKILDNDICNVATNGLSDYGQCGVQISGGGAAATNCVVQRNVVWHNGVRTPETNFYGVLIAAAAQNTKAIDNHIYARKTADYSDSGTGTTTGDPLRPTASGDLVLSGGLTVGDSAFNYLGTYVSFFSLASGELTLSDGSFANLAALRFGVGTGTALLLEENKMSLTNSGGTAGTLLEVPQLSVTGSGTAGRMDMSAGNVFVQNYTNASATGVMLDPANGACQHLTLSGNVTLYPTNLMFHTNWTVVLLVKNGGTYTLTFGTNDVGHTFKRSPSGNVLTNTATANAEDCVTFNPTMDGTNVMARIENNFGRQ